MPPEGRGHSPALGRPVSVAGHRGEHFRSGLGGHQARDTPYGISVLRALRLLRIFKVTKYVVHGLVGRGSAVCSGVGRGLLSSRVL